MTQVKSSNESGVSLLEIVITGFVVALFLGEAIGIINAYVSMETNSYDNAWVKTSLIHDVSLWNYYIAPLEEGDSLLFNKESLLNDEADRFFGTLYREDFMTISTKPSS